jgi:flagellar biosynthesis protein FlhF
MAFRRPAPRPAEKPVVQPEEPSADAIELPPVADTIELPPIEDAEPRETGLAPRDWASDETGFLEEVLRSHSLPDALVTQLQGLATAPVHTARIVDRLAVALAAHFHFLPLEEAMGAPMLLYGVPGAGVSTLTAKLAAKFDAHEILVVSTNPKGSDPELEENLAALDLPLAVATDAAALRSIVASAGGRKVIIDSACGAPSDKTTAQRLHQLSEAAHAESVLVLAASTATEDATSLARAAVRINTHRMIVTQFDTTRYLGAPLIAAETGKLAFVAASVTPHFAFGLRVLTPENMARRVMAAALKTERWRIAPL